MIKHVGNQDFNNAIKTGTVIVDFFAEWCGPCKMLGPIFEEVSNEVSDVQFIKVNVDEAEQPATALGISSIPTLVLFKDGKELKRHTGFLTKDALKAFIK